MAGCKAGRRKGCCASARSAPQHPLLLCLVFPAIAATQATSNAPPSSSFTTSTRPSTTSASSSSTSSSALASLSSSLIPSASASASHSTSRPLPTPAHGGAPAPPTPDQQRNGSIVNLYFLILAGAILLAFLAYWVVHRRKKEKQARSRNTGQRALARDIEGWVGQRRWRQGHRWAGTDPGPRMEEGLDERGEAPPPYQPPADASSTTELNPQSNRNTSGQAVPTDGLSIPLSTFAQPGRVPQYGDGQSIPLSHLPQPGLPQYEETLRSSSDHHSTTFGPSAPS
ncbi:MAG: Protein kinase [Chaenotheca gracillima]|nr:MAG: Protein kinase [Chaenotheca gracillima]